MRKGAVLVALLVICLACPGCSRDSGPPAERDRLVVVTTLFPLYDFARSIGGDEVRVRLLLPPGVEPHSFEPRPADIVTINGSDVFIYTGDAMEPWAGNLVKGLDGRGPLVVDAGRGISLLREPEAGHGRGHEHGHEHSHGHGGRGAGNLDPHIWLDFGNSVKMVETIGEALVSRDPARRDTYLRNAAEYAARLRTLDDKYRQGLSRCDKRVVIHGGHFAFNYLATRYGLRYVSAYRGGGETEPSPRDVTAMVRMLRAEGVKYVFYEELVSPRLAETIAREVGGGLLKLHGAHNVTKEEMQRGVTFISLMEDNLVSLRTGLVCR